MKSNGPRLCAGILLGLFASLSPALAQVAALSESGARPVPSNETSTQILSPLPTLTLRDALERAQRIDPQFQSAVSDAKLSHEDQLQSRAAPLPTLGLSSQYLNTQGNDRVPTGRYVTQDGVHVYREWSVLRQDLSPSTLLRTDYRHARVAEAVSQDKSEKARLALAVTVVKAYYTTASSLLSTSTPLPSRLWIRPIDWLPLARAWNVVVGSRTVTSLNSSFTLGIVAFGTIGCSMLDASEFSWPFTRYADVLAA